jgi:ACS family pantothenate transporter-like MFS transporter
MNLFSNVWALWYGIVVFPVVQAPRFKNGQIATIVCGAASVGIAFAIVLLSKKYYRDHPEEGGGGDGDDVVEYQSGRESGATADEAEKDAVDGEAVVYDVDK